jgi:cation diffusion facilitator CzcD-associated flavoprotein CzcO
VSRLDEGDEIRLTCNFLYMCQGYYNQDKGYMPEWPGMSSYRGRVIHPMEWTEDTDYTDKNILVIGSGATAATVVPEFCKKARHVTVLQRSPTYFIPGRNADDLADTLRQLEIDEKWIHEIVRRKRLFDGKAVTDMSFNQPEDLRTFLLEGVKALLPEGYDMKHFTPSYRPWQQRIAFVPDGDLFAGIREGKTTMVTDEIDTFTETGVVTKDGTVIEADIVVPATGFNLSVLGDIPFEVDGRPVSWPDTVTYRGMMFTGVPNLAWIFGYFRASWTLRVDLMGDFIGRLFALMDRKGARKVTPRLRPEDAGMEIGDWIRPDNFNPNYLMRSMHQMPKSGDKPEWKHDQDYWSEKDIIPTADLEDGCLVFE